MKVYTEVNYIWKDNKLVQTDSKSFDYEGEIELCHWYHRHSNTVTIPTVADVTDAVTTGAKSGATAIKKGWDKMREDNPDPNLNVQTPKDLYDKGRQALHDAATNASQFINKNTDSIYTNPNEEYTNNPQGPDEEYVIGGSGRSGYATLRGEGSSVASNKLRRGIPILRTLSGKAKPKA